MDIEENLYALKQKIKSICVNTIVCQHWNLLIMLGRYEVNSHCSRNASSYFQTFFPTSYQF